MVPGIILLFGYKRKGTCLREVSADRHARSLIVNLEVCPLARLQG